MIQRNTVQRRQVLEAVQQLYNHPTAEDIYEYLTEKQSGLGRATIYRNLNVLCEQGLVHKIEVPDAPARFDHTLCAHYHLQCRCCGSFGDVSVPEQSRLDRAVSKETGYTAVTHDIVFSGVCPACREAGADRIEVAGA
jgi:Fur family peroxide stress response transcriptional regulator